MGDIKPKDVRDAILKCFTQAHSKELEMLKEYCVDDKEFERLDSMLSS